MHLQEGALGLPPVQVKEDKSGRGKHGLPVCAFRNIIKIVFLIFLNRYYSLQ